MMRTRRYFLPTFVTALCLLFVFSFSALAQPGTRTEIRIPDILSYTTLKCDFHMHTVFSDGSVWPSVRPEEAWREGLDAISITDHIEYQPKKDDLPKNLNRSHELATPSARSLDLVLVKGSEITRGMPPGHFNTLFLDDAEPLDTKEWRDSIKAAADQDAFIFWNHPGSTWHPEHTEMYENKWLHGAEVVNGGRYYPEVHKWCLEKGLTMLGNTDVHGLVGHGYDFTRGAHRSMTLVFATEKTNAAIKGALFDGRTAVYWEDNLVGEEKYLRPIFDESIEILNSYVAIKGKGRANIQVRNDSDLIFRLALVEEVEEIGAPKEITLYGNRTMLFRIWGKSDELAGEREISIPYKVTNLMIAPEEGLPVDIELSVTFTANIEQ